MKRRTPRQFNFSSHAKINHIEFEDKLSWITIVIVENIVEHFS